MPKIVDHDMRRQELVEESWRVIARDGLEGVTMRKVAAAANCTTGRITHYFSNREDLILAAMRAVYNAAGKRMAVISAGNLDPAAKLQRHLEETLPLDEERLEEWKVWIAFWSAASSNPDLAGENDRRHRKWRNSLIPLITGIAPQADAGLEADILLGIVDGTGLQAAVNSTPANRARAKKAVAEQVSRLVRAGRG